MEEPESVPVPLCTFWEPFVRSKMDIWDVWSLQVAIVAALVIQGLMTVGMLWAPHTCAESFCGCMLTSEGRDRHTVPQEL